MSSTVGDDPCADVLAFSRPGASLTGRTDRRDIQKLTEVGRAFLLERAQGVVEHNANEALMIKVYGSDGTPMLTDRAWLRSLGARIIRRL